MSHRATETTENFSFFSEVFSVCSVALWQGI